jgi:type IV pilus assembly protein PilX
MKTRQLQSIKTTQHGTALIISMLLLIAIAVIGFAAIGNSTLQERIAGNERDRTTAFNAAESALRNAEDYLRKASPAPVFGDGSSTSNFRMNTLPDMASAVASGGANTGVQFDVSTEKVWSTSEALTFMLQKGVVFGSKSEAPQPAIPDVSIQPRFFFEEVPRGANRPYTYRITAVGWGRSEAVVVLQSYYTPPQATADP